jgi:hypothetical protein
MRWKYVFDLIEKVAYCPIYLAALNALGGEFILVALSTVDIVLLRNEGLCS